MDITRRPLRWQRRLCDAAGLTLLASGAIWLLVHYAWGAGAGELPHALEPWMMKVHGLAAMAALFALGSLASNHVPHGLHATRARRDRRQRRRGQGLLVLAAMLVTSGYLLYYFVPETWRSPMGLAHSSMGVAMTLLLVCHRRRRISSRPVAGLAESALRHTGP